MRFADAVVLNLNQVEVQPECEYPIAGVFGFGKGLFRRAPILGTDTSYRVLNRLTAGHLVVSRLKAFEGAIAVVPPEFEGLFLSPEFPTFAPISEAVDIRYLANLCRWPELWSRLAATSKGVGARRERVNSEDLLSLEIPLPSLDEQRRAASRLDRMSERSALASAKQGRARTLRAALRSSLVAGLGRPMGATGWQRRPLSEVLTLSAQEVVVQPMDEYRIAGVYSFGRGLIERGSIRGSETSYKMLTRLRPDDVVVSKLNGWEGAVAVIDERFAGAHVSPEYPTFTIDQDQLAPSFFRGIATSPWFWEQLLGTTRGSMVRRKRVSAADVLGTTVLVPPIEEQRALGGSLDAIDRAAVYSDDLAPRLAALVPAALNEAFGSLA